MVLLPRIEIQSDFSIAVRFSSDEHIVRSRSAALPKDCNRRGAIMVDGFNRTQPDVDLAAVRRISRPVILNRPEQGFTIGTKLTVVAMALIVFLIWFGALAPMAPPG